MASSFWPCQSLSHLIKISLKFAYNLLVGGTIYFILFYYFILLRGLRYWRPMYIQLVTAGTRFMCVSHTHIQKENKHEGMQVRDGGLKIDGTTSIKFK